MRLMTEDQVRRLLRRTIRVHGSLRSWARAYHVNVSVVSDTLNTYCRPPGPQVLAALGLEKIVKVRYKRKETT